MQEKTRIQKDITLFHKNLKKINKKTYENKQQHIIELATQYAHDADYYLKKQDYLTAFGCINYAHGLLDTIIKF